MESDTLHPAILPSERLLKQCDLEQTRRSGPGGQHRNKVQTAIVLRHRPSGVVAEANERRSQVENRRAAVFRLRKRLALELRTPGLPHGRVSDRWRQRCRNGRIAVNPEHDDFPALLAEALDRLAACEMDVRQAAETLGCTSSQLIKLLAKEPPALDWVNQQRRSRGLHPLRE